MPETTDDWIRTAEHIRTEQSALPAADRLYIGGALIWTVLTKGVITSQEIHRFAEYDTDWNSMNAMAGDSDLIVSGG